MKKTDKQKREAKKRAWLNKHADLIDAMIDNPKFTEFLKKPIMLASDYAKKECAIKKLKRRRTYLKSCLKEAA